MLDVLPAPYAHLKTLGQLTAAAFGQRRKMLRRSLKVFGAKYGLEPESWCEACGIDPKKRPEELEVSDFHRLTDYLINHNTA